MRLPWFILHPLEFPPMALFTHALKLLPLLLAGSLNTAHAQVHRPLLAFAKNDQQPAAPAGPRPEARGTSLESLLQELKVAHHAYFLYRSELVRDKFVNLEAMTFRSWEDKLTYAVTVSGLRVEKTNRNVYVISGPQPSAPSLQPIGGNNDPAATAWLASGATTTSTRQTVPCASAAKPAATKAFWPARPCSATTPASAASLSGQPLALKEITERAAAGLDPAAEATMQRLFSFFGRALATVVNILDPDVIVIGGGVGNIDRLYTEGVRQVAPYVFDKVFETPVVKPLLGDSGGVFGAAYLVA